MKAENITVTIEATVCNFLKEYANHLIVDHGLCLEYASFNWRLSSIGSKPGKLLDEVKVQLSKDVR